MKKEKIILAYSGGLDTSVAIKWLQEKCNYSVIAVVVNLGEEKEYDLIRQKAIDIGAERCYLIEAEDVFAKEYISPAICANALYQGEYPLISALSRSLIAKYLVEIANKEKALTVAHGCTGKGNDQVRLDLSIKALDPNLKIIAPIREWSMSREEAIDYAKLHGIPLPISAENPFSIDQNLWGRSCECGVLENPWVEPPENAYGWTSSLVDAPDVPQEITIEFTKGIPTALNDKELPLALLIHSLNEIAGAHGIGRIDHIEDRLTGIKSREIYEAPAAITLIKAHKALESITLIKEVLYFKPLLEKRLATLIYEGLWYSPLHSAIIQFIVETQKQVTGTIKLKLYKGNAIVVGRKADKSLYKLELATYQPEDQFDHQAAKGFIKIWGLPLEIYSSVNNNTDFNTREKTTSAKKTA